MAHGQRGGLAVAAVLYEALHLTVPVGHGAIVANRAELVIGQDTHSCGSAVWVQRPMGASDRARNGVIRPMRAGLDEANDAMARKLRVSE
jgi:hypothetical protein